METAGTPEPPSAETACGETGGGTEILKILLHPGHPDSDSLHPGHPDSDSSERRLKGESSAAVLF